MRFPWPGLILAAALVAAPASATFPGKTGRLAYVTGPNEIHLTGTGRLIPHTATEYDFSPSFSPDGTKVAFVRQTTVSGGFTYRIMVVNADGTGLHQVASSNQFGVNSHWSMNSTAWTADGERVSFIVQGNAAQPGIWTVGSQGGGLTRTVARTTSGTVPYGGLNWSPVGRQLVYPCTFRQTQFNSPLFDLCVFDEYTGIVRQLPIDWPGEAAYRANQAVTPKWAPDGEKIVFTLWYVTYEHNLPVDRSDIFSIDASGGGLEKLSDSGEPVCPGVKNVDEFASAPARRFSYPAWSPTGKKLAVTMSQNLPHFPDCRPFNSNYTYPTGSDAYELGAAGMPGAVLQEVPGSITYLEWEPIPVKLILEIDDGHGHALHGLKVELKRGIVTHLPDSNEGGSYAFDTLPAGDYVLRMTLVDNKGPVPAFAIHHDITGADPVWIERNLNVPVGERVVDHVSFEGSASITDSNVDPQFRERLDDMAAIYWRTRQFVDWVKANLTSNTGPTVEFRAFATGFPDGDPEPIEEHRGYYMGGDFNQVLLGTALSMYEMRSEGGFIEVTQAPENGEWHEFTHHLQATHALNQTCDGENHGGYANEDTCDSMLEGFATYLAARASQDIDGTTDSWYATVDLDAQTKAWSSFVASPLRPLEESIAVAALFWDLTDPEVDSHATQVVGADGLHRPATYIDTQAYSLTEIWSILTTAQPETVRELRTALGSPDITVDLDADAIPDVAPLDEVFLMHGFFPVDVEQAIPGHKAYHYDVAAAQRESPFAPRNDHVGFSDHRIVDNFGTELDSFIPRFNLPAVPGANLAFDVVDASGTPITGATVELTVSFPGMPAPQVVSRALETGSGALVPLELPPYYDRLLPVGAALPPCDPATDVRVDVSVRTIVNGYVSTDTDTFDNCTYQHAIAAATGPAALELTATFPEDSTAPISTVVTTPTGPLVAGGGTLGIWLVRLACADPVTGGFASGCRRTEYRVDDGEIRPYARSIEVEGVGSHVVEFRSVDGGGNEEAFQSVTLVVAPPPDADGDGLSDATEIQIGTNPNDADTDNDALDDGDEVERGTNPLATDSDGDGLGDGTEVGLGTNPLAADTDADGLSDGVEVAAGLNPLDPDTDDDGALDGPDNCRTLLNPVQLDSDADGRGDLCDVCPDATDPAQGDLDGDGAGDACDCAPSDPSQRAPASPVLLAGKSGSTIVLSWEPVAGGDDYAVMRGDRAGLAAGDFGSCSAHTGTALSYSDPEVPASGGLFVYLVQAQSFTCGIGSLGFGANETRRVNLDPAACEPAVVAVRTTVSETPVAGTFSGTHVDTHTSNGVRETIYEQLSSGGNPSNRYSYLEHRFVIDVAPGEVVELLVEAHRGQTFQGDGLRFEWSTNGTTFTPVSMEPLPFTDDGTVRVGPLPGTLVGPVTIRVVDTDRTPGLQDIDWLSIDRLVVRSITF